MNKGNCIVRRYRWVRAGSAGIIAGVLTTASYLVISEARLPAETADVTQQIVSIDPPAPIGSTFPSLAVESPTTVIKEHQILMTWLEPGESGRRLRFSRLSAGTWSEPVTVAEPISTLGKEDQPSLAVIDTQAVRRTLVARTGDVVARSGDGGRTWTRLPGPELPFSAFAGGDEGGYVFWLDADQQGSAKLFGSRILAGETVVDPRVVGGSSVAAAMTWDGPVVAYRDQNPAGGQDIVAIRRRDAQWTEPRLIRHEEWLPNRELNRGPRAAAQRRQVAIGWYTETDGQSRVLVSFSANAGRTFGPSVEVAVGDGDRAPSGAVDIALDDSGNAVVLWRASVASGEGVLYLSRVSPDYGPGSELVLAKAPTDRMGDAARIGRVGDRTAVSWTDGDRLRVLTVPLEAIPAPRQGRPGAVSPSSKNPASQTRDGPLEDSVSSLELTSLDGDIVSLASLRGRAVLLNLWATWCLPCLKEMPVLSALHERYDSEGLVVVGASVDDADASDRVRRFVAEQKIPFAVWRDPEMLLYGALRSRSLPATLVIARDGRVLLRRDLAIEADDPEIAVALRQALKD